MTDNPYRSPAEAIAPAGPSTVRTTVRNTLRILVATIVSTIGLLLTIASVSLVVISFALWEPETWGRWIAEGAFAACVLGSGVLWLLSGGWIQRGRWPLAIVAAAVASVLLCSSWCVFTLIIDLHNMMMAQ